MLVLGTNRYRCLANYWTGRGGKGLIYAAVVKEYWFLR